MFDWFGKKEEPQVIYKDWDNNAFSERVEPMGPAVRKKAEQTSDPPIHYYGSTSLERELELARMRKRDGDVQEWASTPTPTATPQVTSGGNSIANRTRRNNVTPTGDNVVIVEPDPVVSPTAKPQVTDRDFDYVAPSTPTTSSTPGDYVIQKGDTLWDLTGGDQEKIKELAALNNIKNVDLILAGATLKTPSMDYLNRQVVG